MDSHEPKKQEAPKPSKPMSHGTGLKARRACVQSPYVYMRKDGLVSYLSVVYGRRLEISTNEVYKSLPGSTNVVVGGQNFVVLDFKLSHARKHPPASKENRLRYLAFPATYVFSTLLELYETVYGQIEANELRRLCTAISAKISPSTNPLQARVSISYSPDRNVPMFKEVYGRVDNCAALLKADDALLIDDSPFKAAVKPESSPPINRPPKRECSPLAERKAKKIYGQGKEFANSEPLAGKETKAGKFNYFTSASMTTREFLQLLQRTDRKSRQGNNTDRNGKDLSRAPLVAHLARRLRATDFF